MVPQGHAGQVDAGGVVVGALVMAGALVVAGAWVVVGTGALVVVVGALVVVSTGALVVPIKSDGVLEVHPGLLQARSQQKRLLAWHRGRAAGLALGTRFATVLVEVSVSCGAAGTHWAGGRWWSGCRRFGGG